MNRTCVKNLTATVVAAATILGIPVAAHAAGPTAATGSTVGAATTGAGLDSFGDLAAPVGGYFGSASVWKTPQLASALNPASAAMTANLVGQVQKYYGGVAALNVWQSNESLITAPAGTATTRVIFDDCQHKGYTPAALYGPGGFFLNVPIPANAVPATGTDAGMAIYSASTDQLWSFWKASHQADGWHACWGGRIDSVSTSPGYFLNGGGATATGLSSEGGAVTIRDVESGVIDHAMSLAIPDPAKYTNFSWPAQRSDGSVASTSNIPEGTRFRLDPSINVAALKLTPVARMIAVAAQKYGFIVSDKAGAVSVITESGNSIAAATGRNPWTALLGATPSYSVLANFPWASMQALPANQGKPIATLTVVAPTPKATVSPTAAPTATPAPTAPAPTAPAPTATATPAPTATVAPAPTTTATPAAPTATAAPTVTATATAAPAAVAALPGITGISPKTGPIAGGTRVTVTGSGFSSAMTVAVGANAATNVVCTSTHTCTVTTPAGTRVADITVTTAVGTSPKVAADAFTYK